MIFSGGQILQPEVISIYLGTFTPQQVNDNQTYLQNLAGYVSGVGAPPGMQPTIWQYGVRGMTVGQHWMVPPGPVTNLTDSQVRAMITGLQSQGKIPSFGPERLFMVFTNGVTFANPYASLTATAGPHSSWCSYHAFITPPATGQWYGLVPLDSSDGCPNGHALTFRTIANASTAPDVLGWHGDGKEVASTCNNDVDNQLGFGAISTISDNRAVGSCTIFSPEQLAQISPVNGAFQVAFGNNRNMLGVSPSGTGDLGGTFNSPPVSLANVGGAGHMDIFGQGLDNNFYHRSWNGSAWVPAAPNWNPLSPTGVTRFVGQPAVVSLGGQRIDLFAQGINGAYIHKGSDNVWPPDFLNNGWHNVGGTFNGPPAVVTRGSTAIEIFGRGIDSAYYRKPWDGTYTGGVPNFGAWEGPVLGSINVPLISEPVVISASDRVVVFGQRNDGSYLSREWINGTGWLAVQNLAGNYLSPPAAAYQGTGTSTIDVVGQGTDGCYYHQQRLNGTWGPLRAVGGCGFGRAALLPSPSSGTKLYISGTDRGAFWKTLNGITWGGWTGVSSGALH
jgi:hypothetical protein